MVRILASLLICLVCSTPLWSQEAKPTADEALKRLKEGNARFVADMLKEATPPSRQRLAVVDQQKPIATILTCSDSRSAPEYIFDKGIGGLFVVRVAGNVGGPEVYASMEYAAAVLDTPLIVVLGHTRCGAVEAAFKAKDLPSDNLRQLIQLIQTGDKPKDLDAAIHNNVRAQVDAIPQRSKILKDFQTAGRIKIVPAVYDLKTGEVQWLEMPKK